MEKVLENNFWRKIAVSNDSIIRVALELLSRHALRIVLVVDSVDNLIGVVTDGDIRRGLLAGHSLDDKITLVMNDRPIVAKAGTKRKDLLELMNKSNLLVIPLLEERKVVGIETIHGFSLKQNKFDNPVLIMAGGFGSRLKPLTNDCPKPMLKVGDYPLLHILIKQLKSFGFWNLFISVHYMPNCIIDYFGDGSDLGVKINYLHEERPLGTGGALSLLDKYDIGELPVLVINGDILTTINLSHLLEFHYDNKSDATLCVRDYEYQIPYGIVEGDGNTVKSFEEKPKKYYRVNAGIYVISYSLIKAVPQDIYIDLPTVIEKRIGSGQKITMYPFSDYWLDIGGMDDFRKAQVDIKGLEI